MTQMILSPFSETITADGSNNLDSANPTGAGGAPLAPTGFTSVYLSDTSLSLAWTDNATNELNYELDRSPNGTDTWTALADPAANATSATSTGLTVDTEYFYRLRAVNASGNSSYATANGTTTAPAGIILTSASLFGAAGAGVNIVDEFAYTDADGTSIPDGAGTPYKDNTVSSNNPLLVDKTVSLTGRTGSMKGLKKCQIQGSDVTKSAQIYISWFQRWDVDLDSAVIFTTNARSDKVLRVWDNEQTGNTRISWTKQHMTYEDPLGSSPNWSNGVTNGGKVDVFQRFEIFAEKGVGFQTYVDGVARTATTDYGDNFPADGQYAEMFGYDMSNTAHIQSGQTFTTNIAELVALDGHARVEFSNTAAWGASGAFKRYRQTNTSWSASSINIGTPFYSDLNQGAGLLYAHIVLSDGSVIDYGAIN